MFAVVPAPPPNINVGGDSTLILQVLYWLVMTILPIVTAAVSAWWAYRQSKLKKRADHSAAKQAQQSQLAAQRAKELSHERDTLLRSQELKAQQQREFYQTLMEEVKALRQENQGLRVEVAKLRDEVKHLEKKLDYYERNPASARARVMLAEIMNSLPHPAWIRGIGHDHWYLNDAYCEAFSIERRQGFWTPINIFGRYEPADAARYAENDLKVIQVGVPQEFEEKTRVRITDPRCEEYVLGRYRKTPIFIEDQPFIFGELIEQIGQPES